MFYKKRCSLRLRKIHRKTPVPEFLFLIKLQLDFIKKEALAKVFSCEFRKISKSTFFTEHLWATASAPPMKIERTANSITLKMISKVAKLQEKSNKNIRYTSQFIIPTITTVYWVYHEVNSVL